MGGARSKLAAPSLAAAVTGSVWGASTREGHLIIVYSASDASQSQSETVVAARRLDASEPVPADAVWIDMVEPTAEEDRRVETALGIDIPTHADPDYAEPPESHYLENGARYLHAYLVADPDGATDTTGVTFVIGATALVTVRYRDCDSFELFARKLGRSATLSLKPDALAAGLITTVVNRSARALAKIGRDLDQISLAVFKAEGDQSRRSQKYSETLTALGETDEKISSLRESLVSIERLLLFLAVESVSEKEPKPLREAKKSALRDLQSLEEDANFKAQKVQFLLDATLGLINLAQNDIIKLFSVLAVIFMPPTLIASIYGMNFKNMPELDATWGYPLALAAMVCAAAGPYLFFRWKRWF